LQAAAAVGCREKHAGTSAQVDITYSNDDVEVVVLDDGGPPHAANGTAAPGHGIIGMRERVSVFGGELSAGPRAAGGFEVRARLPFQAARR
jgi:signal transduction histidine kinase